ncbi:MAG: glycosyltransferase family 4 protein [Caldisericum sp.]|uniref:glycosyltransferase family 4 protein n=1 Tax=Caldisericum sp. TaxID=2499687 RepID=UPI003D0B776C
MRLEKEKIKKVMFLATVDATIYAFLIPHMKILREMDYEVEAACSNVGFTDKIEKEGFKVYNLPFRRNPFSISNIKAFLKLYRIMKENNYLMLHTHTPVASFLGRIAGRLVGIPHIVYTAHGFHFHERGSKIKNFVYYRLERFAGRFTDALITINTDDYRIALEEKLIPYGKVFYVKGVGVDVEKISPQKNQEEKPLILQEILNCGNLEGFTGKILVSIGRLEGEKHFDHIIKALFAVKSAGKAFKCVIAGDGSLKNHLVCLAKNLKLQENIYFTGYTKKVIKLLSVSDIFVFASSREGLPVSVMEAMAMEKPVVAYNIRGVRDLVEDGVNGFLLPFGDIEGLANKIIYLMENPEIAKEMGRRGREKIEKEFSLKIILKDMKNLYKEILDGANYHE